MPKAKGGVEPSAISPVEAALIEQKLASAESQIQELETRVEVLEEIGTDLDDIAARLDDTPAVGLRHKFTCHCGASGFVALRIRCTKCGRETWWGWHPER